MTAAIFLSRSAGIGWQRAAHPHRSGVTTKQSTGNFIRFYKRVWRDAPSLTQPVHFPPRPMARIAAGGSRVLLEVIKKILLNFFQEEQL
ncbi:hypothetical protein [Kamptonema formosum]|uniref:hypothetical protein n=1 Tax=Kamptonema formosum TaxID=331992 RepID=UPI000378E369|nr:hypothetical protein [Oscillatoria sp. PCC 10802]